MSGEGLQRFGIADGTFNSVFVRVTPYSTAYAKDVASAIKDKLGKQNIRVATFSYQDPDRHWGRAFMDGFNLVQEMLAVICILMSAVLVYNTLTNLTTQQTDQIGILKAIGARTSTIIGAYLVSAFVYGLLALIVALPLGALVAYGITRYFLDLFNIDFAQFHYFAPGSHVAGAGCAGSALCWLACRRLSRVPASRSGRHLPATASAVHIAPNAAGSRH